MSENTRCHVCNGTVPAQSIQRDRIYRAVLAVLEYVPPGPAKDELVDALLELGSIPTKR
jgi:hypothetical protein